MEQISTKWLPFNEFDWKNPNNVWPDDSYEGDDWHDPLVIVLIQSPIEGVRVTLAWQTGYCWRECPSTKSIQYVTHWMHIPPPEGVQYSPFA